MRRTHAPHVFVAVALVRLAAAVGGALRAQLSHAAPSAVIVFASDRDKVDPGEIDSLAAGTAPQTAIMVANADRSGVRTLSTAPFRRSGRPAWQPA